MNEHWENVADDGHESSMERLRVPGGWIYRSRTWGGETGEAMAICFVPEKTKSEK